MTVLYSPGTGFFYDDEVSTVIPEDACAFSAEERDALLAQQRHGRQLVCGPEGLPVIIDAPPLAEEVLAELERYWRSGQLLVTDGFVTRHRDEIEEGVPTTLSSDQYAQLQRFRRQLRAWPESEAFPLLDNRPEAPEWMACSGS